MGTVGLSFGSPTSGTGFNVSQTVATIVSNLQNVETPWKNQLTALENQDAVLSNLGTLFSSLSNDINSLTDFQGVLATKTGSSSDPNVLELTAASPSATAGTHSVVVNSLAQTSSGYLTPIASASDNLAGSITLQVGPTGKPQTITLNSTNNTLAGLAAAINQSGAGIRASVLTDANGSRISLVSGTSGSKGNIQVTDSSIVDTTGETLAYNGAPASASKNSAGTLAPIANAADALTGSIAIQVGSGTAQTFTIGSSTNTLATLAGAINTAAIGVTASVITNNDGSSSLSLVSNTAGTAGNLSVTSNVVDPNPSLAYASSVIGSDASLNVDGVNLTSSSNTVTNLIPGVTFQLLSPSPNISGGSAEQVQVVVANDNNQVASTVNQFVTDYNSLVSAINAQEGNTSSGTAEPLFGSPTLSLLQQELVGHLISANPNGYLDPVKNASDTLTGSISIAVGSSAAQTITLNSSDNTLSGLARAINSASLGVTANVVTNSSGTRIELVSNLAGANGALTVNSSIADTATGTAINYNNGGSDLAGLNQLGISVNNNGSLTLDASALDSILNSDYSGVVGFFQNANSWGMTFADAINNAGSGSSSGVLTLAENSNSNIEATLNANITRENATISAEQTRLTLELNTANEVLQALPSQLNDANLLYSAITGYNQNPH